MVEQVQRFVQFVSVAVGLLAAALGESPVGAQGLRRARASAPELQDSWAPVNDWGASDWAPVATPVDRSGPSTIMKAVYLDRPWTPESDV